MKKLTRTKRQRRSVLRNSAKRLRNSGRSAAEKRVKNEAKNSRSTRVEREMEKTLDRLGRLRMMAWRRVDEIASKYSPKENGNEV